MDGFADAVVLDPTDALSDLDKYSPTMADGAVLAYPVDKTKAKRYEGKRDMEFTIKAQVVKAAEAEAATEEKKAEKDEL